MADYLILKAVEHAKLPVRFRKRYPTLESLVQAGWWTQKKYDGCMGVAFIGTDRASCKMQSRTGEDYSASCEHILDELYEAKTDSGQWAGAVLVVIGEVWQPIEEATFPTISGNFRRQRASPTLKFIANDLLPAGLVTPEPYRLRFADLCTLLPLMSMDEARCHVAFTDQTETDPYAKALQWQGAGGFDGAILRDPDSGYTIGTVKAGEIVKVKPTLSLDLRCNGVIQGEGKHYGKLGAITVSYNGVNSAVGTGFSDADRESMWAGALMSTDESPIDRIVEIECLGVTADGKLREPRFKGVRFDKVQPD